MYTDVDGFPGLTGDLVGVLVDDLEVLQLGSGVPVLGGMVVDRRVVVGAVRRMFLDPVLEASAGFTDVRLVAVRLWASPSVDDVLFLGRWYLVLWVH